jgi:hypothetical protein
MKLLLDVDGVVFPYGSIAWEDGVVTEPTDWDEPYVKFEWHDYFFDNRSTCHLPVRILDALKTLNEHFEIVWGSLRGESARQFEDMLGLPELGFLEFPQDKDIPWKLSKSPVIEKAMTEPFAWIDDAAIPPEWCVGDHPFDFDIHVEVPRMTVGMTPEHVERLVEFANA